MIAHVIGRVVEKFGQSVIVDVNGVGYEVQVSSGDFDAAVLETDTKFYTYHHIREQSQELYGFSSLAAKKIFELLITVQGVGPKAALAILSLSDSETVRNAIARSDAAFVAKASGVGKKTADRVVVDLSDKVGYAVGSGPAGSEMVASVVADDEALEALIALGFGLNDAARALDGVSLNLSTSERVRLALKGNS